MYVKGNRVWLLVHHNLDLLFHSWPCERLFSISLHPYSCFDRSLLYHSAPGSVGLLAWLPDWKSTNSPQSSCCFNHDFLCFWAGTSRSYVASIVPQWSLSTSVCLFALLFSLSHFLAISLTVLLSCYAWNNYSSVQSELYVQRESMSSCKCFCFCFFGCNHFP